MEKTDTKSNDIKAISKLLEMLTLKKTLTSIDAMRCQEAIAEQIISKKAAYLLSVSGMSLCDYPLKFRADLEIHESPCSNIYTYL